MRVETNVVPITVSEQKLFSNSKMGIVLIIFSVTLSNWEPVVASHDLQPKALFFRSNWCFKNPCE